MADAFSSKNRILGTKTSKLLLFSIVFSVFVVGVSTYLIWTKNEETTNQTQIQIEEVKDPKQLADEWLEDIPDSEKYEKIALIGKEYVFDTDLRTYLSSKGKLNQYDDPDVKAEALDELIKQSIALQEGEKKGVVSLTKEFFNNPNKDTEKRYAELSKVQSFYYSYMKEGNYIIEGITLFFVNTYPGEMVQEKGRDYVKDLVHGKITDAYNKVKDGSKTIQEVGEELTNDPDMPSIDPNYKNGIYVSPYGISPNLSEDARFYGWDEVMQLQVGEMTDVLLFEVIGEDGFYCFYKLNDIVDESFENYEDWIDSLVVNYDVTEY